MAIDALTTSAGAIQRTFDKLEEVANKSAQLSTPSANLTPAEVTPTTVVGELDSTERKPDRSRNPDTSTQLAENIVDSKRLAAELNVQTQVLKAGKEMEDSVASLIDNN